MPHNHHFVFSYDQVETEKYSGDFRVDLLKSLLSINRVETNSFEWWVETTFTFIIKNDERNKVPIEKIIDQLKKDKLISHLNYYCANIQLNKSGNPIQRDKANLKSKQGFQDDVVKAKQLLKPTKSQ